MSVIGVSTLTQRLAVVGQYYYEAVLQIPFLPEYIKDLFDGCISLGHAVVIVIDGGCLIKLTANYSQPVAFNVRRLIHAIGVLSYAAQVRWHQMEIEKRWGVRVVG